ncbi:unnamed protein product [Effrenium voratum]|nr:unnamed protein product [Effrenium voratum]
MPKPCDGSAISRGVQYCIDNNARLQVVPGDAPEIWNGPFQPKLLCALQASDDAEIELEVTLKLRGFIYPLGARIALPALFNCREATIMQLHETGKYALRFDGGQEKVLYEPDLTNHVPAGVWRYGAGQKLMVFIEGKWRDVRVHKLGVGSSHILESSKKRRWEVDLNSYNHSPAWLGDEWWWQMRQWEDVLLCRIGATDALSGQPAEILSLHWSLVQQHLSENQGKTIFDGLSGDYDTGQPWSMLLQLAQRAAGRSMGRPPARKPVLLLGSVGSGKTRLLRRLASEALHAHEGEMVPLLVNALQLLIGTSISTRVSNENCQQKSFMRPSVKDSEKMALRRLASLDFLAIYIRMAYGCSATGRFLRQAAHARRLLLLVDGLELCPKDLQKPLLEGLARLSAVGHRVVVAASPPAHLFGHLRPVEKVEAEEEVNDADGEAVIAIGGRSSSGKIPAGNKNPAENLPKEDPEPYWCSAFNQVRQIWLCPLTPSQLRIRAQMRLGHLGDAPERVLEQLKEARLLQVLARSAPFFELALSHMERLLAKDAPSRPSRSQRSTPSDGADEPDRVSLPPLKPPAQAQAAASSVGTCALLGELVAAACRLLMQSLQDVKMQRRGRQRGVDSNAGDHLQMALQFLALKALETSSDRLDEEEATAVIEFAGSSALMATWRELQELRDENFWLLRPECWHSWDRHVVYYSFPCPCIQSYLASLEVAASWGKTGCLHCLEEVFEESRWQQLLPFLAELLPGPLTLEFASLPEHQAQLMAEFFSRQPAVVRLDLAGCQLGMNRSTLRFVAAALRDDQSLRHLDLSDNALGSEGVHSLCQALAQHPSLKELKLGKNHIGQVGAVKVVDLLRVNHRILRVDLEDNPIGSEWANYIYILQRDRTATLQSARRQNRMGAVPKLENIEAAPETERPERITSMSSRLRREDPQEEKVRSARTPRLVA